LGILRPPQKIVAQNFRFPRVFPIMKWNQIETSRKYFLADRFPKKGDTNPRRFRPKEGVNKIRNNMKCFQTPAWIACPLFIPNYLIRYYGVYPSVRNISELVKEVWFTSLLRVPILPLIQS